MLAARVVREVGGTLNWLARSIACEIEAPKSSEALSIARELVGGHPIDCALVPKKHRRKKLLLADMDSTMINEECIDELADAHGVGPQVAAITEKAMSGEINFTDALNERVMLLKGVSRETISLVRRLRITFAPGGRALVHTMKAHGAHTALVSGGFDDFAKPIADRIGFDEFAANRLEFDGDVLTGKVASLRINPAGKLNELITLASARGLDISQTLAVGDGANDLPMIDAAGLGVALHAKPGVAARAPVRIDHGDLTSLLYLQGYNGEEFVL